MVDGNGEDSLKPFLAIVWNGLPALSGAQT